MLTMKLIQAKAQCSDEEAQYLCDLVNDYLDSPISVKDVIWTYSGVRPLYDDDEKIKMLPPPHVITHCVLTMKTTAH